MSSVAAMWSPLLFGFTLFLSSALLFMVQPMLGRTLLPHLGGNPIAWNACLVFFQATLLAGYVYAGLLHRFGGLRWQPWQHLLLMAVATTLCFVGIFGDQLLLELAPRLDALADWPVLGTLCLLIVVIGLPFFALAAVSPLVQRWFAHLDHPKSSDPYFLFVASNLGGLLALVVYALLIEPFSPLYAQWMSWKLALTALGVAVFIVALCAWRSPRSPELEPPTPTDPNAPLIPRLIGRGPATWSRRCYWLFAAAVPVGLMMATTDYLTTDVAPVPILWTVPLALYLTAFSQAFARFSPFGHGKALTVSLQVFYGFILALATFLMVVVVANANPGQVRDDVPMVLACSFFFAALLLIPLSWLWIAQPISVLAVVFLQANLSKRTGMNPGLIVLYLTCFYLSARLCLGMLAKDRPAAPALTTYFTWIGIGGLCGGLFQLFLAPLLFRRDFLEYSLLAALASTLRAAWFSHGLSDWLLCLLLFPKRKDQSEQTSPGPGWVALGFDLALALVIAVFAAVIFLLRSEVRGAISLMSDFPLILAMAALLLLFARPVRFGLALAAIVALCWIGHESQRGTDTPLVQRRTSFGILRVDQTTQEIRIQGGMQDPPLPPRFTERRLMHATTHHGSCITTPPDMMRYPTTYYHRKGPVGQVMRNLEWFPEPVQNLRGGNANFWLQRNRDNAKDDARIAASLIGMGAGGTADLSGAYWSEPPYAFVGLGTGTQFTYAHPFQYVDAYELDPAIIELSTSEQPVFHYFQSAQKRGVNAKIIPGDARQNLRKPGREGFYHVLFVDAFNSDAIPTHLLTKEAIELYFQKLIPDGVVCFHTSNRYVDLSSVLENTARNLNLASAVLAVQPEPNSNEPMFFASEWVVLARNQAALQKWTSTEVFDRRNAQAPNQPRANIRVLWTDEQASLLSAVRPGQDWPKVIYGLLILLLFFGIVLGFIEIACAMMALAKSAPDQPSRTKKN